MDYTVQHYEIQLLFCIDLLAVRFKLAMTVAPLTMVETHSREAEWKEKKAERNMSAIYQ